MFVKSLIALILAGTLGLAGCVPPPPHPGPGPGPVVHHHPAPGVIGWAARPLGGPGPGPFR